MYLNLQSSRSALSSTCILDTSTHAHCRRADRRRLPRGTNTRRVRRALAALFRGAVSKDIVSRVWRKIKSDWDFWSARSLAAEPIVRLILDGTVVRVRLDRKATSISLLVVIGVREDGQKVLLAVKNMGGESAEAWRSVLDDLIERGLRRPAFLIVDGAPGLERAIAAVWDGVPVQRCTVHKHRNLLAHNLIEISGGGTRITFTIQERPSGRGRPGAGLRSDADLPSIRLRCSRNTG